MNTAPLFAIIYITIEFFRSVTPLSNKEHEVLNKTYTQKYVSVVSNVPITELGEGPFWDGTTIRLYFVDAVKSTFHRLQPEVQDLDSVTLPSGGIVSIIIPYEANSGNTFLISNSNKLHKLDWPSHTTSEVAVLAPELNGLERFNDAKCDPKGRLIIGTVRHTHPGSTPIPGGGSIYRLKGSEFVKLSTGYTISNGMAWSKDGQYYFNDSEDRKIYSFDYDLEKGSLNNRKILIDCNNHPDFVPDEYPDGMAIDVLGFVWVAMWNGGRLVKINPKTARVVDHVTFPRVRIPSSVAFGTYQGHFGLFVTTAYTGIPSDEILDDGKIHHVRLEGEGGEIRKFNPNAI